jgi:hypothetical protein
VANTRRRFVGQSISAHVVASQDTMMHACMLFMGVHIYIAGLNKYSRMLWLLKPASCRQRARERETGPDSTGTRGSKGKAPRADLEPGKPVEKPA